MNICAVIFKAELIQSRMFPDEDFYGRSIVVFHDVRQCFFYNADKAIFDINNNLDKMYMDKLRGVLQEEDYIRVSQKFNLERTKLNEQKLELEQKLIGTEDKNESKIHTKEEKELDELIENFLKLEKVEKIYLYRLINKIEIDKDKNIYIYFKFSKLNSINENLNEFIKIEEIINEKEKTLKVV